jgi:hypothetical protein
METTRIKNYFAYALVHQASPKSEATQKEFGMDEFCKAREAYLQRHENDTAHPRKGHFTTGLFPNTQLYLLHLDADRIETERTKILSNRHQPFPLGRMEPLAKQLIAQRSEGMEWFVENTDDQRVFFATEPEAITFANDQFAPKDPEAISEKWQLFNLDRHLDFMEGQSIQHFLQHRSALSTNQLEILADLGRGTLSKIKNGQRVLSRKQYGRIVRVLQHYGYVAWVDLRQLVEVEAIRK